MQCLVLKKKLLNILINYFDFSTTKHVFVDGVKLRQYEVFLVQNVQKLYHTSIHLFGIIGDKN